MFVSLAPAVSPIVTANEGDKVIMHILLEISRIRETTSKAERRGRVANDAADVAVATYI